MNLMLKTMYLGRLNQFWTIDRDEKGSKAKEIYNFFDPKYLFSFQ